MLRRLKWHLHNISENVPKVVVALLAIIFAVAIAFGIVNFPLINLREIIFAKDAPNQDQLAEMRKANLGLFVQRIKHDNNQ